MPVHFTALAILSMLRVHVGNDKQASILLVLGSYKNQFAVQIERRERSFPSRRFPYALWPGNTHNFTIL